MFWVALIFPATSQSDAELNDKIYEIDGVDWSASRRPFLSPACVGHGWMKPYSVGSLAPRKSPGLNGMIAITRKKLFDKFLAQHDSSTDSENVHLIKGFAPDVISSFVCREWRRPGGHGNGRSLRATGVTHG